MIRFTVFGVPQPRGSKAAVLIPKKGGGWVEKNGRPIVAAKDSNPRSKDWMNSVRAEAMEAYDGPILHGPISVELEFYMPRPKGHYGTGKNADVVKGSSPVDHVQKPDADKLARGTIDALKGVMWLDDCQIVQLTIQKGWTTSAARAVITIFEGVP